VAVAVALAAWLTAAPARAAVLAAVAQVVGRAVLVLAPARGLVLARAGGARAVLVLVLVLVLAPARGLVLAVRVGSGRCWCWCRCWRGWRAGSAARVVVRAVRVPARVARP
jgi:hypothetical protein